MVRWASGPVCLLALLSAYACSGTVVGSSKTVDVGNDGQGGARAQSDGGEQPDGGVGAPGDGGTRRDGGAPSDGAAQLDGGDVSDAAFGSVSGPHSGTRIKVRGVATPDGTALSGAVDGSPELLDSTRNVGCQMALAQDGVTRCLPVSSGSQVYFTDPACTVPVIEQPTPSACVIPGPYATRLDPLATCWQKATTTVYSVGAGIAAPAAIYSRSINGCSAVPGDLSSSNFFEASVSPPTDWVSFDTKVEKVTNRIGVAVLIGSDGSLVPPKELRLLPENSTCEGLLGTDGRLRCIPTQRSPLYADFTSSVYSGADCQTPAVPWNSCSRLDVLADLAGQFGDPVKCGPKALSGPIHLASAVAPSDVFVVEPETRVCTSLSRADGSTDAYYVAGKVVPETDFPPLETVHEGSGRIQTTYVTTGGQKLYAAGLYDEQTKSDCTPRGFGPETVCAPSHLPSVQDSGWYADPACTNPLYDPVLDFPPDACASPASFALVGGGIDGCGFSDPRHQGGTLHRIGALHVGATYALGVAGGTCNKSNPSAAQNLYDLGPVVDPVTVFVTLTPVDL